MKQDSFVPNRDSLDIETISARFAKADANILCVSLEMQTFRGDPAWNRCNPHNRIDLSQSVQLGAVAVAESIGGVWATLAAVFAGEFYHRIAAPLFYFAVILTVWVTGIIAVSILSTKLDRCNSVRLTVPSKSSRPGLP